MLIFPLFPSEIAGKIPEGCSSGSGIFDCGNLLGFGLHIFQEEILDIFFSFRDRDVGILAQAMEKNNRVQNFSADDTMPSEEDVTHVIEFFKDHPSATSLAVQNIFTRVYVGHHAYSLLNLKSMTNTNTG